MSVRTKLCGWCVMALLPSLICGPVFAQTTSTGRAASDPYSAYRIGQVEESPSEVVWSATLHVKRFVENPIGQETLKIAE